MSIHEPATLLTDWLLAAFAGGLAWHLRLRMPAGGPAVRWWSWALWLTATSAFVGGGYHGFASEFPEAVARAWWMATLLIICVLSAAMAMSLLHETMPANRRRPWPGLVTFKLAAFAGAAFIHPVFVVVVIDYGLVMLAWTVAALVARRAWSGWMLVAVALSVIAALVQQTRGSLTPRFNHNDLYHVIQALALVGFYRAGRRFTAQADAR